MCTSMQKISSIHQFILEKQQILEYHDLKGHIYFLIIPTQYLLKQFLAFLKLYQYAKNQFNSSIHSSDTADFRVPWPKRPRSFFDHTHSIFIKVIFSLFKIVSVCKKSVQSINSSDTADFRDPRSKRPQPFLDQDHPKIIEVTFGFFEFVSACKKSVQLSFYCWDTADSRVPWFKRPDPFLITLTH